MLLNKILFFSFLLQCVQIKTSSEKKSHVEQLIEKKKNIALAWMQKDVEDMRQELENAKKEIEKDTLAAKKGQSIKDKNGRLYIILYKMSSRTERPEYESPCFEPTLLAISKHEVRQAILKDIGNGNSDETTKIVNKAENILNEYAKSQKDNIDRLHAKLLTCIQDADDLNKLRQCKNDFSKSVPSKAVVSGSYCDDSGPHSECYRKFPHILTLEEIVAAKNLDNL